MYTIRSVAFSRVWKPASIPRPSRIKSRYPKGMSKEYFAPAPPQTLGQGLNKKIIRVNNSPLSKKALAAETQTVWNNSSARARLGLTARVIR